MSRIYSSTNRIKFTDIPEKYSIPRQFRGKQSEVHSAVVTYVFNHYRNTNKFRQKVVDALNKLTFYVIQNQPPPFEWSSTDPLDTMPDLDIDVVEETLTDFYLTPDAIIWDVPINTDDDDLVVTPAAATPVSAPIQADKKKPNTVKAPVSSRSTTSVRNHPLEGVKKARKFEPRSSSKLTPKEDLYIQPPKFPRFDVSKVWISANVGADNLVIYTTLPEIPTRQNEISITTNLDLMTESELLNLYPNCTIHTRSPIMYERHEGMDYDDELGCIIPIESFTREQVVDNIIKYPHLYRLRKFGPDGRLKKFFSTIEIDGDLIPIKDVWDTLPESKLIPKDPEFIKEYVIRRYLLERDNGMNHEFKMFGCLDPFLTLFMPPENYRNRSYKDAVAIAKQCVASRIRYKQSRSPILRRIEQNV